MDVFEDPSYNIASLKRFVELIDTRHYSTPDFPFLWLFRGHSDSRHSLIPGIGRLLGAPRFPSVESLAEYELSAFRQFEILTYSELKESNPFIILAAAQHHGLKTRLLDWTTAPLVALFFAVEDENYHNIDGAFFAYNANESFANILRAKTGPFDPKNEYTTLYIPSISPRIRAQNGFFQLFKNPTVPMETAHRLEKFIIPAAQKNEIKIQLYKIGVTYQTMFPGFDGISKTINYSILNDKSF